MTQRSRRDFTEAEILEAQSLHDKGASWADVALRLGRSQSSLESTLCRYRRGTWQGGKRAVRNARIAAEMERLVEVEGVTVVKEIASRVGISESAASHWLSSIGLDREMRAELAGTKSTIGAIA